jgi:hypothetical protein
VDTVGGYGATEGRGHDPETWRNTRPGPGRPWRGARIGATTSSSGSRKSPLAFCVAGMVWLGDGRPAVPHGRRRASMYAGALIVFTVATLIFRRRLESFSEPTSRPSVALSCSRTPS